MKYRIIILIIAALAVHGCVRGVQRSQSIWIRERMPLRQAVALLQEAGFERQGMSVTIPSSHDERGHLRSRVDMIPIELDVYVHEDGRAVFLTGGGLVTNTIVKRISYIEEYSPETEATNWVSVGEIDLTKH